MNSKQNDADFFSTQVYGSVKTIRNTTIGTSFTGVLLILVGLFILLPLWAEPLARRVGKLRQAWQHDHKDVEAGQPSAAGNFEIADDDDDDD